MKVFVDTSALYALIDEADPMHLVAARTLGGLRGIAELVTHNYVLVETITLVRRRLGAAAELRLIDSVLPLIGTIWVDKVTHNAALAGYRGGGSSSLVDHVSFAVMRAEGVTFAWAYDRDFEREGLGLPAIQATRKPRQLSGSTTAYESASDLVSVAEIAARSGRSVNTVQSWRRRHPDFPAPVATLAAAPVWAWPGIERWIARRRAATAEPTTPLFESSIGDLASRTDEYLEGFGTR
jgi:predicted nucleic acid-binding protein